jgi:hypothetical protein
VSDKSPHDDQAYLQSRHYLKGALEHLLASGRSLGDLFEFAFDKFGEDFLPYLLQFFQDIREGRIRIEGLGKSTRDAILGYHVTLEERDNLIREAAYYKSEKHGFSGSTEQDWAEAEKEVDTRLEGLIGKSTKLLAELTAALEDGMSVSQREISQWLEKKAIVAREKTGTMKKTAGMKSSSKSDDSKKDIKVKSGDAAVKKKTTRKKARKKKVSKKKEKNPNRSSSS